MPRLFATVRPPDVVLLHTSMPRNGKVSLGIEVNVLVAAIEQVRARRGLVVAQMNPRMPYTCGDGELDEELIAIEVDELPSPTIRPASADTDLIAEQVAHLVSDSSQPVTSFQHSAVINEQGCAHLFGRSARAQARLIVENAEHPDAREGLREHVEPLALKR
ncbi:MAG TPA: acetyl-CoA hydrolase/transferase C-terminal domain-containing protein [Solirubrobacteraceae bacterium]|nr:acetyl-CoA hydrolase/transferase C-terminal domain-containing protein [Solirubrobacteraceae bacterium]